MESPLTRSRRAQAAAIAMALHPLVGTLGRTLSWRVDGVNHFDDLRRGGRSPVLAFWHGRVLPATLYFRDRGIVVMTSENFDGEWITRLIGGFGFRTARGSTSRGGSRALVQLRRELNSGHPAGFAIDGPRGPARIAQPGAVWLAGATGHPVLPFHIEADRYWTAGSWDRTVIPKPFSSVAVAMGDPLYVAGTAEDVVEQNRRELETRLAALEQKCLTLLGQ